MSGNAEVSLVRQAVAAFNNGDIEGYLDGFAPDCLRRVGHVCALWTLRGVHVGEYGGIAPTHREIGVDTCEVYTFTGDRVTECYVYGEAMSIFNQLSASAHD
jgi:hypothetical protein